MKSDKPSFKEFLKNLKFSNEKKEQICILFLLGIFFMLVATPVTNKSKKMDTKKQVKRSEKYEKTTSNNEYIKVLENKLEQTIEGIEGAGNALVMITLKNNGEKILDKNQPYETQIDKSIENGKESEKNNIKNEQETVLIEQEGDTIPIVIEEIYPKIEGVVVVCDGGDNPKLCMHIKEIVKALFSVDSHKIVVSKLETKRE